MGRNLGGVKEESRFRDGTSCHRLRQRQQRLQSGASHGGIIQPQDQRHETPREAQKTDDACMALESDLLPERGLPAGPARRSPSARPDSRGPGRRRRSDTGRRDVRHLPVATELERPDRQGRWRGARGGRPVRRGSVKTYLFSYRHNGAEWSLEIPATSPDDAKARLAKLPNARFDGELVAEVPSAFGWLARLWVWLRADR